MSSQNNINLEIILIIKREIIAKWWPIVVQDLRKVLKYSFNEESEASILSKIVHNELHLWLVSNEQQYIGFFTTEKTVNYHETPPVATLIVHHAYHKDTNNLRVVKKVVEFIENHATINNCRYVKHFTVRDYDRYWGRLGYQPRYTEYTKEVQLG